MVNTWLLFLTALNINKDYTQPILWNHLLLFVICKNICGDTRDLTDNPGSLRVKYNLQMVKMVIFVEYKLHYALKLLCHSAPLPHLAHLGASQCWPQVTKELSFLAKRGRGAPLVTQGMSISSHRALLVT